MYKLFRKYITFLPGSSGYEIAYDKIWIYEECEISWVGRYYAKFAYCFAESAIIETFGRQTFMWQIWIISSPVLVKNFERQQFFHTHM